MLLQLGFFILLLFSIVSWIVHIRLAHAWLEIPCIGVNTLLGTFGIPSRAKIVNKQTRALMQPRCLTICLKQLNSGISGELNLTFLDFSFLLKALFLFWKKHTG